MSQSVVGALRVNLGMDSAQFERGIKRASGSTDRLKSRMASLSKAAAAAGAALAVAGGAMVRSGLKSVDAQAKLAQSLDTTVASIQTLERAGELAGVSMSGIEQATKDLERRLSQAAAETGPAADALDRLGLSATNLIALPLDERVGAINAAIKDFVPAAERAAVAGQLFGEEGSIAMSRIDTATLRQATEDVRAFGVVVSEQDAEQIERTNDAISRLGLVWRGLSNQLAVAAAPALEAIANALAPVARAVSAMASNIDQATGFVIAGAAALTTVYTPAIIAATVATGRWVASLVTLRGALMATGIGAVVVLGGMAINKLLDLRETTGSLGSSFVLLGDVASDVWGGIVTSAGAIIPGIAAVWQKIKETFYALLSDLTSAWAGFLGQLGNAIEDVPLFGRLSDDLADAATGAISASGDFAEAWINAGKAAEELGQKATDMALGGLNEAREALGRLSAEVEKTGADTTTTTDALTEMETALNGAANAAGAAGGSGGGLAPNLKKTTEEVDKLAQKLDGSLRGAIGGVSSEWGDFITRGFQDFEDFADGIVKNFRRMLSDMIAMAARNQIMISLGMSATGSAASAGQAASTIGQAANAAGTAAGAASTLGQVASGLTGVFSSGGGGLGASFSSLGGLLTGAGGGASALGAAIPAAGIVIGGAALMSKLFGSSKTTLNMGLNVGVGDGGLYRADQFSSVRRSSGLRGSNVSVDRSRADAATVEGLENSVASIQGAARAAAEALDIGAEAFQGFSYGFEIKVPPDASPEEQAQKVTAALTDMGDHFARMIPQFSSLNELLETANERLALEDRLLQAQGKTEELRQRQRERELAATHEVNRAVLQQIYALEDQAKAQEEAARVAREQERAAEEAARALTEHTRALEDQGRAALSALQSAVTAEKDRSQATLDANVALIEAQREASRTALDEVRARTSAEIDLIREAAQAQQDALRAQIDAQNDAVAAWSRASDMLSRAVVDLRPEDLTGARQRASVDALRAMQLSAGRGVAPNTDRLSQLLTDARPSAENFGGGTAFALAQAEAQQAALQLGRAVDGQLSVEQQTLEQIKAAAASAGAASDRQIAALEAQTAAAEAQHEQRLAQLKQQEIAERSRHSSLVARLDAQLAAAERATEIALGTYVSTVSVSEATKQLVNAVEAIAANNGTEVPAFARGGFHSGGLRLVGENGPEIEATGPSRIIPNSQIRVGGENVEVTREMIAFLREIARDTRRSYNLSRQWDVDGLPGERT